MAVYDDEAINRAIAAFPVSEVSGPRLYLENKDADEAIERSYKGLGNTKEQRLRIRKLKLSGRYASRLRLYDNRDMDRRMLSSVGTPVSSLSSLVVKIPTVSEFVINVPLAQPVMLEVPVQEVYRAVPSENGYIGPEVTITSNTRQANANVLNSLYRVFNTTDPNQLRNRMDSLFKYFMQLHSNDPGMVIPTFMDLETGGVNFVDSQNLMHSYLKWLNLNHLGIGSNYQFDENDNFIPQGLEAPYERDIRTADGNRSYSVVVPNTTPNMVTTTPIVRKKGGSLTKQRMESLKYSGGPGDVNSTEGMKPNKKQKKMMKREGGMINGAEKITIFERPGMFDYIKFLNNH